LRAFFFFGVLGVALGCVSAAAPRFLALAGVVGEDVIFASVDTWVLDELDILRFGFGNLVI